MFNIAIAFQLCSKKQTIRNIPEDQDGLKVNETRQHVICGN